MKSIACSPIARNGHTVPALVPAALLPSTPAVPEATHSVNVFFEVVGYGKAQATGRGASAQEAARNLADTIRATKAALETPAPQSREQRLSAVLTCGMRKATAKQDWNLVEKLAKAAALVLAGAVSPGEREGMLAVQSMSTPAHWYEVELGKCTCPDFTHHSKPGEKWFCKHLLASMLWTRLEENQ